MMCKLNFSGLWNIKGNLENLQSLANPFSGIRHGSIFKLSQNSLKIGRKYRLYRIFNRCGGCVYIRVVQYFMYIRVKGTLRVLNCFRKYGIYYTSFQQLLLQVRDESYIKYIKRKVAYKAAYKSLVKLHQSIYSTVANVSKVQINTYSTKRTR